MSVIDASVRECFPVLARKAYLNSCSYGALSLEVKAGIERYLATRMEQGARWDLWVAELEQVRGLLARLLGCNGADVAVTTSVSESLNNLASAMRYDQGRDTVVVTDFDFPTTSQIWLAQQPRGARVLRARARDGGDAIPIEAFDALIDERTALVSIPLVCYRNGVRLDPEPIVALAHARGARVVVDAYQGLGAFAFDARAAQVDFLVGGCLKYLIGTAGVGFLYVRDSRSLPLQPTASGWFAQHEPGAMDIYHHRPAADARRFEAGTPNVCGLHAVRAGLELLLGLGLDAIERHNTALTAAIAAEAAARGWALATPAAPERHGAMMAIRAHDAPALTAHLAEHDVVVSDRDGNVRVSPHFYNNGADLERLFDALDTRAELIVSGG